jgi:hypothetical protein
MVAAEEKKAAEKRAQEAKRDAVQVDDLLSFRQFAKKATGDAVESVCVLLELLGKSLSIVYRSKRISGGQLVLAIFRRRTQSRTSAASFNSLDSVTLYMRRPLSRSTVLTFSWVCDAATVLSDLSLTTI